MTDKQNGSLAGRVAVVTGASGGLGRAVAVDLARHGARVAVCSRREAEGRETIELVREAGGDGLFARCDVSRNEEVRGFIALVVARLGRIDCAVNNAATIGVVAPLKEYPEETFDQVMAINVKGTWLCMKYEIQAMLQGGTGGSIVNVSSVSGLVGVPWGGAPYSASKHAVVGLTRCAALEVGGAGIRVNALCPSGFDSELNKIRADAPKPVQALQERVKQYPLKRRSTAEEIARTVVWLCGDNASFMTGATVAVDGGLTAQ